MELDLSASKCTKPSKSRLRRMRAAKTKQSMWEAIQHTTISSTPSTVPTAKETDTSFPQFASAAFSDVSRLDAAINVVAGRLAILETTMSLSPWFSCSHFPDMHIASYVEPLFTMAADSLLQCEDASTAVGEVFPSEVVTSSEFSSIRDNLDHLNFSLCSKLYSNGTEPDDMDLSSCNMQCMENRSNLADISVVAPTIDTTPMECDDVLSQELQAARTRINASLDFHRHATDVAQRIESGEMSPDDAMAHGDDSLEAFILEVYRFKVPKGIRQRQMENEEYEIHMEEEEQALHLAKLGHVFTFYRKHFWRVVGDIPGDVRRDLVAYGTTHPGRITDGDFDSHSFEELFWRDTQSAYLWQECYNDADDNDELMQLLSLLRRAVSLRA